MGEQMRSILFFLLVFCSTHAWAGDKVLSNWPRVNYLDKFEGKRIEVIELKGEKSLIRYDNRFQTFLIKSDKRFKNCKDATHAFYKIDSGKKEIVHAMIGRSSKYLILGGRLDFYEDAETGEFKKTPNFFKAVNLATEKIAVKFSNSCNSFVDIYNFP